MDTSPTTNLVESFLRDLRVLCERHHAWIASDTAVIVFPEVGRETVDFVVNHADGRRALARTVHGNSVKVTATN